MRFLLFLLPACSWAQPTVTWTFANVGGSPAPSGIGYMAVNFDALSSKVLMYGSSASNINSIYSTTMWASNWNLGAQTWTQISTTGSTTDNCPIDTNTIPGDRHPVAQQALDTKRNLLWMFSGVDQICNGAVVGVSGAVVTWTSGNPFFTNWGGGTVEITGTSCTSGSPCTILSSPTPTATSLTLSTSPGNVSGATLTLHDIGNTSPRQDLYYLSLNSNAGSDTWTRVFPGTAFAPQSGSATYDSIDDAMLVVLSATNGNTLVWRYCSTIGNPIPGTLTSAQSTGGCTMAMTDNWAQDSVAGNGAGGDCTLRPCGNAYTGFMYDSVSGLIFLYGGVDGSDITQYNEFWAYDPHAKTWAAKCSNCNATTPPKDGHTGGLVTMRPTAAYNSLRHTITVHCFNATSCPSDWEYDPGTNLVTQLSSSGSGPNVSLGSTMAFDAANNRLLDWASDGIWVGQLGSGATGGHVMGGNMTEGGKLSSN